MEVQLIVVGGKASKGEVTLKLPAVIGRSPEADLTIAHPMVSRQHCQVFEVDGLLMVRDLSSLNGTKVAGEQIGEAAIRPDSEFTVGPLTFRARYEYDGDLSAIPPAKPPGAKKGRRGALVEENLADSRWQAEALPHNPQTLAVPVEGQRRGPSLPAARDKAAAGPLPDFLPLPSDEHTADAASPDDEDAPLEFEEVAEGTEGLDSTLSDSPSPIPPPASPPGEDSKADSPPDPSPPKGPGSKPAKADSFEDEVLKDFLSGRD